MTKRKIYARELFRKFDFYHLAKEFYYYIFRYPELESEPEWKEIKEFAEDIIVTHRCSKEYGDKLDPDDYRDFLRFYTRLEMRDYIRYKKHFCPVCNRELEARYDSRIVDQNSPEGREKDFTVVRTHFKADIEERTWYLYCSKCESRIPFNELKKHEKNLKKSKLLKIFKR